MFRDTCEYSVYKLCSIDNSIIIIIIIMSLPEGMPISAEMKERRSMEMIERRTHNRHEDEAYLSLLDPKREGIERRDRGMEGKTRTRGIATEHVRQCTHEVTAVTRTHINSLDSRLVNAVLRVRLRRRATGLRAIL
jgi:hypothetical protein